MLEEGEGDKALQRPDHRLRDLRLGARRQGGPGLYHSPEVGCHFDELLEPIRRPLGIGDVAAEERGAAVELEIEVAAVRLRLREELHATVLPDGIVVSRSEAAHVAGRKGSTSSVSACSGTVSGHCASTGGAAPAVRTL